MNSETEEDFATRLRAVASHVGSGEELARLTGINRGTLERYLTGKTTPTADRVAYICRVAGVSAGWLVSGQGTMLLADMHNAPPRNYPDQVPLDEDILVAVVSAAEEWFAKHAEAFPLAPEGKARAIRALYRMEMKNLDKTGTKDPERTKTSVNAVLAYIAEEES